MKRVRALAASAALLLSFVPAAAPAQDAPAAPAAPVAIEPARLAAAEKAVAALVPKGIYMTMMRDQMPQMMDAMVTQMMRKTADEMGLPAEEGGESGETLGEAAARKDPAFQERMRITSRVMFEEMGQVFDRMEPRVRAGLARAFARKFTLEQLNDFNIFFATPSGSVFAREYLMTFMDPEMMQEMMSFTPELMKAMPEIMQKAEKATAHLPPPPKPETETDE
ncbi:hypothetical protein ACMGDH_03990 [Sphingomonas sp. DT-207]|uniref:DUF2059 domain-containing protein n=1 Tax=Sphingomonas sp. DT-207 TaxID=3396167 RepID=UPI003F1AF5D7